jgi:sialidase-1
LFRPEFGGFAVASRLEEFLGEPLFVPMQELWEGRGGWGGVLTAKDGTVVAFQSPGGGNCRRSRDGGKTWDADIDRSRCQGWARARGRNDKGDILYVNPGAGWLFRSRDHGASWTRESVQARPDGFGNIPDPGSCAAMQCGITLAFGEHKGRLIMPARVMGPKQLQRRPVAALPLQHRALQRRRRRGLADQQAVPVLGTGEAALAELSDGSILYNSREHMSRGNRFLAHSDDGGDLWIGAYRSPDLPDGARGTSYGLMGGMIRLPSPGHDILLYSNVDTDAGVMPKRSARRS